MEMFHQKRSGSTPRSTHEYITVVRCSYEVSCTRSHLHRRLLYGFPLPSPMPWLLLIVAGLLEVLWASGLKGTQGFTRLWPSVWVIAAMIASFVTLSLAIKHLPTGTAYAVWVGIGAAGVAIVGMTLFKEPVTPARIACLALIIAGVVGLKLLTPKAA
jgi:quaternary ammonium compound-resistance protein SugE